MAMALQQEIALENQRKWVGKKLRVLVEESIDKSLSQYRGRSYMDAPEVDGNVIVKSAKPLVIGLLELRARKTASAQLPVWKPAPSN